MQDRFQFRVWKGKENRMVYDVTYLNPLLLDPNIDPENKHNIVMQCTGMKDKNGKLIYEGDVVERDHIQGKKQGVVVFDEEALQFRATNMSLYSFKHRSVVIGNIYENPDLI